MSIASRALPRRLLTLGLIAAGLGAASSASAACTAGSWVARVNEAGMPPVRYETAHFAFRWNGDGVSDADVRAAGAHLEMVWDTFINRLQFPEPFCTVATKYKANLHLDPSFGLSGGATGSGGMGMWMAPGGLRDHWGLAHELTHALQYQAGGLQESEYTGWIWESHANWMTHQLPEFHSSDVHCSTMLVNYPHVYLGSTRDRYCNWQFMEYLKNRYGYAIINDMWSKAPRIDNPARRTADPFSVIKANMGWTQSQLNDVFGDWAMRNVNWEYTNPDGSDQGALYRARYGSNLSFDPQRTQDWDNRDRALRMTVLDPVAGQANRYRVPFEWAPQRWGYNLVQLIPASGATSIQVAFEGQVQSAPAVTSLPGLLNDPTSIPMPASDWRWGVVAIDSAGKARYSTLQRGAKASVSMPLKSGDRAVYLMVMGAPSTMQQIKWDQSYYAIYRYPWSVTLTNAAPAGSQPNAPTPTPVGRRHANGGGWVANTANVASTAYVGPRARVLAGNVLGNARIDGRATVMGGTVQGNAVLGGLTVWHPGATIGATAQAHTVFMGPGAFGAINVGGTAQLRGDIEEQGASPTQGVFYGFVDPATMTNPEFGVDLRQAVPEITARPAGW
ncbi:Svx/AvrXca family virulence/avirulence protein [Xanthomonas vesicatoria]|uniref:Svx/AvrXca family virulence/avirulence protein n=2 Tax=Xanthomonas vesicatoria TaxID=56460 RepID=UPI000938235D|nr:Svx/AvrXca family virulence/avirulence protein [Xanthomonas vesicatoria]APP75905.1 avirulence protein [Xanthomonas vesicatoria ATCC 35937]MCC8598677.1 Svx/AvrXca family virulence/avirulence protein [Xanthomonas vesicatoria]MCC8607483.1 Svx/AvrXca family virulence/avirulence protein [Xanthomonas vesicatoria]MCC8620181.1 Svx/AvrXca family virulence/avirulence protein [Xanthomonas vesicatoria]MCC8632358.1 Svx/AvrXca family virulence/avirulence protein [Xanthomonas vesicatoria]